MGVYDSLREFDAEIEMLSKGMTGLVVVEVDIKRWRRLSQENVLFPIFVGPPEGSREMYFNEFMLVPGSDSYPRVRPATKEEYQLVGAYSQWRGRSTPEDEEAQQARRNRDRARREANAVPSRIPQESSLEEA